MSKQPLISLIIPTHNRRGPLLRCLDSIAKQNVALEQLEVIVVADSCRDDTETAVQTYAATAPFHVRLVSHTAGSAAATRNLGAEIAIAPTLIFLDDDMEATPGLIAAHLATLEHADVSIGYSRPILPVRPSRWQRDARRWWEDRFRTMATPGHRFSYEDVFSGNLALRAALFARLGGFDLAFAGRLEDYELGMRLIAQGARLHFSYAAESSHHDQSDLTTWLRRVRMDGIAHVMLVRSYPQLHGAIFGHTHLPVGLSTRLLRRLAWAWPQRGDQFLALLIQLLHISEALTLTLTRDRLLRLSREYNYWRGVAAEIGSRQRRAWLAQAILPDVGPDAIQIDLAHLPHEWEHILSVGAQKGLILSINGFVALRMPPVPGAEPLTLTHLRRALLNRAHQDILPAVAIQIFSQGEELCWPVS
ncbi:glycosyl transferase family 2 [Oscillochloris trichoides DG-6]|uniref:Glycosyl transferase family 2 n=1 Tax=Oscillochloris trichoides DG-6 TaxID=765420 RepID=E1IBL4_9CHLR|nr:glycosyltransferase [Oscillochloris trichoides]EFO81433.1 glycosyl transferase family 2 [Oscillochloris trichoides DG-6]